MLERLRVINLLDDKSQMTLIAPLVLEEILNSPVIFRMWGEFVCQSQARPSTKCDYAGYCLYAPKLQAKFKCKFFHVHEFNIKLKPQQSLFLERFVLGVAKMIRQNC